MWVDEGDVIHPTFANFLCRFKHEWGRDRGDLYRLIEECYRRSLNWNNAKEAELQDQVTGHEPYSSFHVCIEGRVEYLFKYLITSGSRELLRPVQE